MTEIETPENNADRPLATAESEATSPAAVERRLQKNVIISILLFISLAVIFGTTQFIIGAIIGGALSYLNYRWLHSSLKRLITSVATGSSPPNAFQAFSKFIFRWLIIMLALLIAYWWGGQKLALGVTVSLLSIANAAILEAFIQVWFLLRDNKNS